MRSPNDALRHVAALIQALRKVALAGIIGGTGCGLIAVLLGRSLGVSKPRGASGPVFPEMAGITAVAGLIAVALIVFSALYFVAAWGLARRKAWARYTAAAVFIAKVLLCAWLGRTSLAAMLLFVMIASLDVYGLWVVLSAETGELFRSPDSSQSHRKPANLVV